MKNWIARYGPCAMLSLGLLVPFASTACAQGAQERPPMVSEEIKQCILSGKSWNDCFGTKQRSPLDPFKALLESSIDGARIGSRSAAERLGAYMASPGR